MAYVVSCPCGLEVSVTATQAGTQLTCTCGRTIAVPRLSDLRRAEGRNSYESGVVDTIARMIQQGELPWGGDCAFSGRPTRDVYEFTVHCERTYAAGDDEGYGRNLWALWLGGFFLFWLMRSTGSSSRSETHGHDTIIQIPLYVSAEYHDELRRTRSQRKLRKLLRTVPIYAQLLEEYSDAQILA